MISIEEVHNGFIVLLPDRKKVFTSLDEVMTELLGHFEGRYSNLNGGAYGVVMIQRERPVVTRVEQVSGVCMGVTMRPLMEIVPEEA